MRKRGIRERDRILFIFLIDHHGGAYTRGYRILRLLYRRFSRNVCRIICSADEADRIRCCSAYITLVRTYAGKMLTYTKVMDNPENTENRKL